jgi:hypothetical protein
MADIDRAQVVDHPRQAEGSARAEARHIVRAALASNALHQDRRQAGEPLSTLPQGLTRSLWLVDVPNGSPLIVQADSATIVDGALSLSEGGALVAVYLPEEWQGVSGHYPQSNLDS